MLFFLACNLNNMINDILAIAVLPFNTPHNIQPSAVLGNAIPISPCKHPANNGGINITSNENNIYYFKIIDKNGNTLWKL